MRNIFFKSNFFALLSTFTQTEAFPSPSSNLFNTERGKLLPARFSFL